MILPTKGISADVALLSVGANVLALLPEPKTVSRVWDELVKDTAGQPAMTYDWFVLALDMLFAMGLLELERGQLRRCPVAEGGS